MGDIPIIELNNMRRAGMTRQQIADALNVSLAKVKRWISTPNGVIAERMTQKKEQPVSNREKARYAPLEDGMSLMDKCKIILGGRMDERRGQGYTLDGRPASSDQIRRAAGL